MVQLFTNGTVAPEDPNVAIAESKGGFVRWVRMHPKTSWTLATLAVLGLLTVIIVPSVCLTVGCSAKKNENKYEKNAPIRLIVSFSDDTDLESVIPPVLRNFYQRLKMNFSNFQIAEFTDEKILLTALAEIKKRTNLEFVVRDFVLNAPVDIDINLRRHRMRRILEDAQPGGPLRNLLQSTTCAPSVTNPTDPGVASQWFLQQINAQGAWAHGTTGSEDIIIAVTDSGAQLDHPDLQGAFWVNPREIPGNGIDDDGNGIIDDINGAVFAGRTCSLSYSGANRSLCGRPNDIVGHGTKIAGVIAAQANCLGVLGVAPGLKVMVLKVTDESVDPFNPPYPYSDIVRAVDYGVANGARIFSMSFGDNAQQDMQSYFKAALDRAANAYSTLFRKYRPYGTLFVAAAGNEAGDLDVWQRNNYTYSPCMVGEPNVLCVGGTMQDDKILYVLNGNSPAGTNYGTSTVDMAAPGWDIYTTNLNSGYTKTAGTSYSTPMTAAVAGIVQSILGNAPDGNGTGLLVKDILMASGDYIGGLNNKFKQPRRLNSSAAVVAAIASVKSNILMTRWRGLEEHKPTVMSRMFNVSYYQDYAQNGQFDTINQVFVDQTPMDCRIQKLARFKYDAGYIAVATALMRITRAGLYGVKVAATGITPDRFDVRFGERSLLGATQSMLQATSPGWYKLEIWVYPTPTTVIDLTFTTPISSKWDYMNDTFFTTTTDMPWSADYDPAPTPLPSVWQVNFNETNATSWPPTFFSTLDDKSLTQYSTAIPDWFMINPTSVFSTLLPPGYTSTATALVGIARANLMPAKYTKTWAFLLNCVFCRLLVNGLVVAENQNFAVTGIFTQCFNFTDNVAHSLEIQFVGRASKQSVNGPLALRWAPCTTTVTPSTVGSAYTSLKTSVATRYLWQPTPTRTYQRGMQCNLYSHVVVPGLSYGARPNATTPPLYKWIFPRDCNSGLKVTDPNTGLVECKINYSPMMMVPNIPSGSGVYYYHRCFTYWNKGFNDGMAMVFPPTLEGNISAAGRQIEMQPGYSGNNAVMWVPQRTYFPSNTYQLVVFEGLSVTGKGWAPVVRFTILNGNVSLDWSRPMTTETNNMILPIVV